MWWRRLIKWLCITAVVLAVLGLIVVWAFLGVNPFEGDIEHLWLLTSNEVDFFVRIPPADVLDEEPLIQRLEQAERYRFFDVLRRQIVQATRDVAREVNPQIPMGLFEVDLKKDFLSREMAVGGTVQRDYNRPRFDNFIVMVRVPFYARFVSALKRGFIRDSLQAGIKIQLVNGLYFKMRLGAQVANALRPYRTPIGRGPGGDQTFYMVRIADVIVFSDNSNWIEHALQGGVATLKADAWFESEFIKTYRGGNRVEMFVRPSLTRRLMVQHAKPGTGGVLGVLSALLPPGVMGELTLHVQARGSDQLSVDLTNVLTTDGFEKLPVHLQAIYNGEKGDPQFDLSENGIARFVPRKRTLGAAVLHTRPDHLVDLIVNVLTPAERQLLDDQVRDVSRLRGRNYPSFRKLLLELTSELASTHLLIVHRPTVFFGQRYERFKQDPDSPLPLPGLSYTLVSSIKESARPDRLREKIFQHLQYVGMKSLGPHKSGKFHTAALIAEFEPLVSPAYGALGSQRFLVFSSSVEGAEAVFLAAQNPDERLIGREGLGALLSRLPRSATVSLIFDGATIKQVLFDRVRLVVDGWMDLDYRMTKIRNDVKAQNEIRKRKGEEPVDVDDAVRAWKEGQIYTQYPLLRRQYLESLAYVDPLETIVGFCALGVGSEKKVRIGATARFATVSE